MEALPVKIKRLCALLLALVLTLGLCSCSIGKKGKYEKAVEAVRNGRYPEAIASLEALEGYEDSAKYIAYARALQAGDSGDYEAAITALKALNGFEKSAVYITSYTTLAAEAEQARMKSIYNQAVADVKAGKYEEAIAAFETLNDYEDSGKYIMYARCLKAGDSGDYETAIKSLTSMGDFKEAGMYIKYYTALSYEASQKYEDARKVYEGILLFKDSQTRVAALPDKILDRDLAEANVTFGKGGWRSTSKLKDMLEKKYSDSDTRMYENVMAYALQWREKQQYATAISMYDLLIEKGYDAVEARKEAVYDYAKASMGEGDYAKAASLIEESLADHEDANELLTECRYQLALKAGAGGAQNAQAAYDAFKSLDTYKDSADRAAAYEAKYAEAVAKREAGDFDAAIALFAELGTYSDATAQIEETQNAKAYAAAVSLMNSEKYEEAMKAFRALNGYSDSAAQMKACETAIPEREYQRAEKLRENGQYAEAYVIYMAIRGYKDVDEIIVKDVGIADLRRAEYQPGNYVTLGTYPQTKSGTDQTPIEWLVLESDSETALLISRYALDAKPYNNKRIDMTWEKCTLRSWLNNDFCNRAFSAEEKKRILVSNVTADKNPQCDTDPGSATKDSVFLLSITEANKYFASDEARMCVVTDYAIQQGAWTLDDYTADGGMACCWWLRSPGRSSDYAALVNVGGSTLDIGRNVSYSNIAVRPCIRVRIF